MTALVLFIIGLILSVVCGLLGGFRQLEEMGDIKGIPFVWRMDSDGDWRIGFFRSPGYDREDLEDLEELEEIETEEKKNAGSLYFQGFRLGVGFFYHRSCFLLDF